MGIHLSASKTGTELCSGSGIQYFELMERCLEGGRSVKGCCLFVAGFLLLSISRFACCQCASGTTNTGEPEAAQVHESFEQKNWLEVVRMAAPVTERTADENYEYGMALAHLQRWTEARSALLEGERACPGQERFAVELAGVAFQLERYPEASDWLRKVLRADPRDEYANNFAGTVYLLMGNTSAAPVPSPKRSLRSTSGSNFNFSRANLCPASAERCEASIQSATPGSMAAAARAAAVEI